MIGSADAAASAPAAAACGALSLGSELAPAAPAGGASGGDGPASSASTCSASASSATDASLLASPRTKGRNPSSARTSTTTAPSSRPAAAPSNLTRNSPDAVPSATGGSTSPGHDGLPRSETQTTCPGVGSASGRALTSGLLRGTSAALCCFPASSARHGVPANRPGGDASEDAPSLGAILAAGLAAPGQEGRRLEDLMKSFTSTACKAASDL
mmetsp:Transcript_69268/g.218876  ORF Transcript_69268/g.218876 Transcript_69268/m.218876 type:complete len:213 (-) Transcript_69268:196-834(-)